MAGGSIQVVGAWVVTGQGGNVTHTYVVAGIAVRSASSPEPA